MPKLKRAKRKQDECQCDSEGYGRGYHKVLLENRYLRRLLMECEHVLTFARNKGIINERLKERIQVVLDNKSVRHASRPETSHGNRHTFGAE